MRIWEAAAEKIGADSEVVRQVYVMIGMGYTYAEIQEALQVRPNFIAEVVEATRLMQTELPPDEAVVAAVADFVTHTDWVREELMAIYQDQKKHLDAGNKGLTRHPDGSAVRKTAPRDMVGTLTQIHGVLKDQLAVRTKLSADMAAAIKANASKKKGALPGAAAPSAFQLAEPLDVPSTVVEVVQEN